MRHQGIKAKRGRVVREVAASLGAPVALVSVFAELFGPLESLGSRPAEVMRLLGAAGIRRGSRVLDLGCGKGSVAVELARRLGCRVVGVDGFEPFVESARNAANETGVSGLCRFRVGDVGEYERGRGRFDAAVMLNLYPCGRAAGVLRRWVKPGGVYVIDDACRVSDSVKFRQVPTRAECREAIEACGDTIEREVTATQARARADGERTARAIAKTSAALEQSHLYLRSNLRAYVRGVRESGRMLGGPLRSAVWVVRRR